VIKERPILFNGAMVRALLDGSKTQTRRAVKPQPSPSSTEAFQCADGIWRFSHPTARCPVSHEADDVRCPYGQPGDRLWVREAWTTHACFDEIRPRDLTTRSLHYQADGQIKTGKNRPSIHMPRWASRITLEITGVRVERLQDISETDALAEGIDQDTCVPVAMYRDLWEQINGFSSWDKNPWVWVVEFKRVES